MIYREWLVMRKALIWFFGVIVAIAVLGVITQVSVDHSGHGSTDLPELAGPGAVVVSIFAAIFGVALGNASRESARVFWTLPVARWKSAVSIVAVDLAAITVALAGTLLLSIAFFMTLGFFEPFVLRGQIDWLSCLQALCFCFAVYAWSALAGMIGRRVAYAGVFGYVALLLWMVFDNLGAWIGTAIRFPIAANPLVVYMASLAFQHPHRTSDLPPSVAALLWMGTTWGTPVLAAIAVLGCVGAITMWHRSEVLA